MVLVETLRRRAAKYTGEVRRAWALTGRQCLIGQPPDAWGIAAYSQKNKLGDCEGKERRAVAGSRCGNKIVLLQGVCVF